MFYGKCNVNIILWRELDIPISGSPSHWPYDPHRLHIGWKAAPSLQPLLVDLFQKKVSKPSQYGLMGQTFNNTERKSFKTKLKQTELATLVVWGAVVNLDKGKKRLLFRFNQQINENRRRDSVNQISKTSDWKKKK